jgi:hypothetical protein
MSFAKYFPDGRKENRPASVNEDGQLINVGYDAIEGVQKVALMTWNSSLLSWERGTITGGGGGGGAAAPTTKRIDKRNATELYVGNAAVGTAESSAGWGIQKITFDASGNATASFYGVGTWSDRYSVSYA